MPETGAETPQTCDRCALTESRRYRRYVAYFWAGIALRLAVTAALLSGAAYSLAFLTAHWPHSP